MKEVADQTSMEDPHVLKGQEGGLRCCFHLKPHCPAPLCCLDYIGRACGHPTIPTTTVWSHFHFWGTALMALLLLACWDELNKGVGEHFLGWEQSIT